MFIFDLETEILWTVSCLIVHLAFLTSYNLMFLSFYKTSKGNIFGFYRFFSETVQISGFKVEYLETVQRILMTFVSFGRILNGLSDEINLFWRCSSPLMKPV